VYSVPLISHATGYNWNLPAGADITGAAPGSITVDFTSWATSGNISVFGTNDCGSGAASPNLAITVVPLGINLQNISIVNGNTSCYNATQTINVAGGGSTFTVNSGGSATMIAGQNVVYLPGTRVYYEGYMHGYIATNGQYCLTPGNPLVNTLVKVGAVQTAVPELAKKQSILLYPNPTHGTFTLELTENAVSEMTKVEIFGMNGVKVLSEVMAGERKHIFTVETLRPGIYIIHVFSGSASEMVKLIKLE
jgi:hypothetical protein